MGQRNVYISDSLQELLEHEARLDPQNTQGKLIMALARVALFGGTPPVTATGRVLEVLGRLDFLAGASVPELAHVTGLSQRVVGETVAVLARLTPSPIECLSGAGRASVWTLASRATFVEDGIAA